MLKHLVPPNFRGLYVLIYEFLNSLHKHFVNSPLCTDLEEEAHIHRFECFNCSVFITHNCHNSYQNMPPKTGIFGVKNSINSHVCVKIQHYCDGRQLGCFCEMQLTFEQT